MEAIYLWCQAHQAAVFVAAPIVAFLIGYVLPNDAAVRLGFNISQFIRRCFGATLENKVEEIVDSIDRGMHSDDKKVESK